MGIDNDVANAYDGIEVKLTFPNDLIVKPIIYEMATLYDVVTNILRANVGIDQGWVVLEISGINSELDKALFWLHSLGVHVDLTNP